jgi:hypothetical protein
LELLDRFSSDLRRGVSDDSAYQLASEQGTIVYYLPFEEINRDARLVLVGITPGPTQMSRARMVAGAALRDSSSHPQVLRAAKKAAAFDGMRPRINEMLDHFQIPQRLSLGSSRALWNENFDYFQPTSIIPNAAFRHGKYFNGPFEYVLSIGALRNEFENGFIRSIRELRTDATFVAMGPVVETALKWCIAHGALREEQYLGYLPHPSGSAGSQFDYFMKKKRADELSPKDPVRHRAASLDDAYESMKRNVDHRLPR